jgi:hypothetical protein
MCQRGFLTAVGHEYIRNAVPSTFPSRLPLTFSIVHQGEEVRPFLVVICFDFSIEQLRCSREFFPWYSGMTQKGSCVRLPTFR